MKKILQVKKGEYLLEIRGNAIATTYNQDLAMDIKSWSLEQVGYIVGNLKKVGYNKSKIVTIEEVEPVEVIEHEEGFIGE
jgi:hypothetical protein